MAITEAGGNLFFYGIQYAIDDIGFNYGVDNLVLGSTEIVATLLLTRFVSKLNRRKTLLIAYLFTVTVSLIFLIKPVQQSNAICTVLIIFIRASTSKNCLYFSHRVFYDRHDSNRVVPLGNPVHRSGSNLGFRTSGINYCSSTHHLRCQQRFGENGDDGGSPASMPDTPQVRPLAAFIIKQIGALLNSVGKPGGMIDLISPLNNIK